ncbi:hypothetical protein FB451DRAFT_1388214 [Mycena latifolia]|nr:hypothetical protein FB451DRAFT_1388214 [Mycena latifolia]
MHARSALPASLGTASRSCADVKATRAQPGACAEHRRRVGARVYRLCSLHGHDSQGALAADEHPGEVGRRDAHPTPRSVPGIYTPPSQRHRALHLARHQVVRVHEIPLPCTPAAAPYAPRFYPFRRGRCPCRLRPVCALRRFPAHAELPPKLARSGRHGARRQSSQSICVHPLHTRQSDMVPRAAIQRAQHPGESPPSLLPLQVVYLTVFLQLHPQHPSLLGSRFVGSPLIRRDLLIFLPPLPLRNDERVPSSAMSSPGTFIYALPSIPAARMPVRRALESARAG